MGTAKMINQCDFIHTTVSYMGSLPVCSSSAVFTQLIAFDGSERE